MQPAYARTAALAVEPVYEELEVSAALIRVKPGAKRGSGAKTTENIGGLSRKLGGSPRHGATATVGGLSVRTAPRRAAEI